MFYVSLGLMKRFSGGFFISISLPSTDFECLIRNLIFNSLKLKKIAFEQCLPLLEIPMIWNQLEGGFHYTECSIQYTNVIVNLLIFPLGSVKFFLGAEKMIIHYYSITSIMRSHDWY